MWAIFVLRLVSRDRFLFDVDAPFFHFEFARQVNIVVRLLFDGQCQRDLPVTAESKPGEAAAGNSTDPESQAKPNKFVAGPGGRALRTLEEEGLRFRS
jgi:hypothetical protein